MNNLKNMKKYKSQHTERVKPIVLMPKYTATFGYCSSVSVLSLMYDFIFIYCWFTLMVCSLCCFDKYFVQRNAFETIIISFFIPHSFISPIHLMIVHHHCSVSCWEKNRDRMRPLFLFLYSTGDFRVNQTDLCKLMSSWGQNHIPAARLHFKIVKTVWSKIENMFESC